MSGQGKPPDFEFPNTLESIFEGQETTAFGPNGVEIVKKLIENQRSLESIVQAPDERFSQDGAVVATESPHAEMRYGGKITEVVGRLKTAGSTATIIDVYLSGSVITTLTIPIGSTRAEVFLRKAVASRTSELWLNCTQAGTGAAGLVVYVRSIPSTKGATF